MDYKQLMKQIKAKNLSKVYLFTGEEFVLSKMLFDMLKAAILNPSLEQLNLTYLDGKSIDVSQIVNACETLPFMDEKRLVVVNDITLISGTINMPNKDIDELCAYMERLPESCCLVFINEKSDKKRRLYKAIVKNGSVVEYSKLVKSDLSKWILKRIRMQKKSIESDALELFIESSDYLNKDSKSNLSDIENEIKKLLAFAKDKGVISRADIESSVEENMDTNIFKMVESIGQGSKENGLVYMNILLNNGEPPVKILFMIVRQLRLIYQSKALLDKGFSTNDIGRIMEERSFVVSKALKQARNLPYEKLKELYEYAAQLDVKMKSSQVSPRLALEMFMIKAS